jgi:hypothetical protein
MLTSYSHTLDFPVLTNNRHPKAIFNFLDLPRELRDMIYEHIVGYRRNFPLLIYQSTIRVWTEDIERKNLQNQLDFARAYFDLHGYYSYPKELVPKTKVYMSLSQMFYLRDKSTDNKQNETRSIFHKLKKSVVTQNSGVTLLSINKQINREALEILYKQNDFDFKVIDGSRPVNVMRRTLPSLRMHFGPLRLTKLRLEYACVKESRLRDISFDGVQNMRSLRTVRLVVSLPTKSKNTSPTWDELYEE